MRRTCVSVPSCSSCSYSIARRTSVLTLPLLAARRRGAQARAWPQLRSRDCSTARAVLRLWGATAVEPRDTLSHAGRSDPERRRRRGRGRGRGRSRLGYSGREAVRSRLLPRPPRRHSGRARAGVAGARGATWRPSASVCVSGRVRPPTAQTGVGRRLRCTRGVALREGRLQLLAMCLFHGGNGSRSRPAHGCGARSHIRVCTLATIFHICWLD